MTFFVFIFSFSSFTQININDITDTLQIVYGDLDGDSIDEIVYALETNCEDFGFERIIAINKKHENTIYLWKTYTGPLMNSLDGGYGNDPFGDISINNKILLIEHYGGNRHKFVFRHYYQFIENEFYLIKANKINGIVCKYWEESTLSIQDEILNYNYELDFCREDSTFQRNKLNYKIDRISYKMNGIYPGEIEILLNDSTTIHF